MFTRFSPSANRVLRAAEQACRNHNHYYVGVGHLLMALLDEHDPVVESRLAQSGIAAADVVAALRRALGTGDDRSWSGILVTPRVRTVVAHAEALASPGSPVEPAHLFDAVRDEGGGLAAEILANLGNLRGSARVAG